MDSRFASLIFFLRGRRPNIPRSIITISSESFWPFVVTQKETLYITACFHDSELQCSSHDSKGDNTSDNSTMLILGGLFTFFRSSIVSHGHLFSPLPHGLDHSGHIVTKHNVECNTDSLARALVFPHRMDQPVRKQDEITWNNRNVCDFGCLRSTQNHGRTDQTNYRPWVVKRDVVSPVVCLHVVHTGEIIVRMRMSVMCCPWG